MKYRSSTNIIRSISLILLTCYLLGCGGSSNNGEPDLFDIKSYKNASVSNEDLTGTWLLLGKTKSSGKNLYGDKYETLTRLRFLFSIYDHGDGTAGYFADNDSGSVSYRNGKLNLYRDYTQISLSIVNNTKMEQSYESRTESGPDGPSSFFGEVYTAIKINDEPLISSTQSAASVNAEVLINDATNAIFDWKLIAFSEYEYSNWIGDPSEIERNSWIKLVAQEDPWADEADDNLKVNITRLNGEMRKTKIEIYYTDENGFPVKLKDYLSEDRYRDDYVEMRVNTPESLVIDFEAYGAIRYQEELVQSSTTGEIRIDWSSQN